MKRRRNFIFAYTCLLIKFQDGGYKNFAWNSKKVDKEVHPPSVSGVVPFFIIVRYRHIHTVAEWFFSVQYFITMMHCTRNWLSQYWICLDRFMTNCCIEHSSSLRSLVPICSGNGVQTCKLTLSAIVNHKFNGATNTLYKWRWSGRMLENKAESQPITTLIFAQLFLSVFLNLVVLTENL